MLHGLLNELAVENASRRLPDGLGLHSFVHALGFKTEESAVIHDLLMTTLFEPLDVPRLKEIDHFAEFLTSIQDLSDVRDALECEFFKHLALQELITDFSDIEDQPTDPVALQDGTQFVLENFESPLTLFNRRFFALDSGQVKLHRSRAEFALEYFH